MKQKVSVVAAILVLLGSFVSCSKKPKTALEMRRDSGELLMKEGVVYMNNGKYDLAEAKLLEALTKNPNLLVAHDALGQVYMYKGQLQKAIDTFQGLIRLNPQYWDAYNSLGIIYVQMDKYDLAKENLLIAANAQNNQKSEFAFFNLAALEIRNNRIDSALRYIEKGLALNNRYGPLHILRGVCLESQGKFSEALESHEKGLSFIKTPSPQQLLAVGRLCQKMGLKKKALDYLEEALSRCQDEALKVEINRQIKEAEKLQEGGLTF